MLKYKLNKENVLGQTDGTSKVGSLENINYRDLVTILGEPTYDGPSGDGKVQFEWVLKYNGKIFTIYDWKTFDREYSEYDLTTWSIGGGGDSAIHIKRAIYKALNAEVNTAKI